MAKEKEAKALNYRNTVKLIGFLKETTLDERTSTTGKQFIWGSVTIAIDEFNTHRVKFTVYKEDNEQKYEALSKFLPSNTVSIASYLKSTPTATFATASQMAAKVWVMGGFEEFASRNGEKERTMVTLKGFSMGVVDPNKEFVPSATFEVDAYLESIEDEVVDEKETGRLLISALLPGYKGVMHRVPLVAPVENNVAKFIKAKYKVGDTSRLLGNLVAMRVQIQSENTEKEPEFFGQQPVQQFTTRFVRENVITGGSTHPIEQGSEGSISTEAVKEGLALRETIMDENGKRKSKTKDAEASVPAADPASTKFNTTTTTITKDTALTVNNEDFDF